MVRWVDDVVWCQVVSVEEELEDCGGRAADFVFFVQVVVVVSVCVD